MDDDAKVVGSSAVEAMLAAKPALGIEVYMLPRSCVGLETSSSQIKQYLPIASLSLSPRPGTYLRRWLDT